MDKLRSFALEGGEARDRRRVKRLAWGSVLLFLVPLAYALTHGDPRPYRSQGNYALMASASSEIAPALPSVTPQADPPADRGAAEPAPYRVKHDQYYCGFYAQAVTGNVTPDQAFRREQTSGAVMGAMGGALLGALFGGSGHHSGRSATVGAGAGLLAGVTMGSGSARRAADDIRSRYDAAYAWCMSQKDDAGGPEDAGKP